MPIHTHACILATHTPVERLWNGGVRLAALHGSSACVYLPHPLPTCFSVPAPLVRCMPPQRLAHVAIAWRLGPCKRRCSQRGQGVREALRAAQALQRNLPLLRQLLMCQGLSP